ncbi:MAG: DUF3833 family protein [Gammaproteobacteria bacterium]
MPNRLAALLLPPVLAGGCATAPEPPAEAVRHAFVLEQDLVGRTIGRGRFSTITGVERTFTARLNGTWDGTTLTLVEDFEFDDGVKERKTWRLARTAHGTYTGTREDVEGQARGFMDDGMFRLEYVMRPPGEDGRPGPRLRFRDVLAKLPDGRVVNHATVGWWGLRVGRVSLVITRE